MDTINGNIQIANFKMCIRDSLQVMENLVADGKMEMLAMVDEDEFVGLAINLIDAEQDRACLLYTS